MSRLGLGNMYVHIVTFILFCLAPFFIFLLGLLYGRFLRIQMRRRFSLPAANHAYPDLAGCLQWLCCYSCSLAQEVRTADAYEVRTDDDASSSSTSHYPTLQYELSTIQQQLLLPQ
jgi:Cys-rich protein (TIGR01571 family)